MLKVTWGHIWLPVLWPSPQELSQLLFVRRCGNNIHTQSAQENSAWFVTCPRKGERKRGWDREEQEREGKGER